MKSDRRNVIKTLGAASTGLALFGGANLVSACGPGKKEQSAEASSEANAAALFFNISLAQWSLHKSFFGEGLSSWENFGKLWDEHPDKVLQGVLNPVDFPTIAKRDFGINAVEYVNVFYYSKKNDLQFWKDLRKQCDDQGVKSLMIMCDREGNLGDTDEAARTQAVENHYGWVDAAKILGCHSIRVNAAGNGTAEEVKAAAIDGLGRLTAYGQDNGINVIVENHGGYSSDGQWLSSVIAEVASDYCGTLPDFGNFCVEGGHGNCIREYDRYQGVKELMPFAKGVSAKSHDFDEEGNETHTDYERMMKIVKDAGFTGYVGVEYEGDVLSEADGIKATKKLLEKVGKA